MMSTGGNDYVDPEPYQPGREVVLPIDLSLRPSRTSTGRLTLSSSRVHN